MNDGPRPPGLRPGGAADTKNVGLYRAFNKVSGQQSQLHLRHGALAGAAEASHDNSGAGGTPGMRASGWHPHQSGSLLGFVCLHLPSGLSIRDCTVHRSGDRRWIGLPGKPQLDADGNVRRGDNGKPLYVPVVELKPAVRDRFERQALAAVDDLIASLAVTA